MSSSAGIKGVVGQGGGPGLLVKLGLTNIRGLSLSTLVKEVRNKLCLYLTAYTLCLGEASHLQRSCNKQLPPQTLRTPAELVVLQFLREPGRRLAIVVDASRSSHPRMP